MKSSARGMKGIEVRPGPRGVKYRAYVWQPENRRLVRRTFVDLGDARRWRNDLILRSTVRRTAEKPSTLESEAYSSVRKAAQRLGRAAANISPPRRAYYNAAYTLLREAEDEIVRARQEAVKPS